MRNIYLNHLQKEMYAKKIIEMHGFQMDFIQQLDEKKIPQIAGYTKEFVIQIADDSYDSSLTA